MELGRRERVRKTETFNLKRAIILQRDDGLSRNMELEKAKKKQQRTQKKVFNY